MKSRRGFWMALGIFLALAAYIRYYESRRPPPDRPAVATPLLAVEPERVRAITVAWLADTTRIERRGPDWRIVSPIDFPADPVAVEALLSRCRALAVLRSFKAAPADRERYGLTRPTSWVRLDLSDSSSVRILIGTFAPASPAYYVQVDGEERVGLLSENEVEDHFRIDSSGWRRPNVFQVPRNSVVAWELSAPGHFVRVARAEPHAAWRVERPFAGPADQKSADDFLDGLLAAKFRSFPDDHPASLEPYGLTKPGLAVTVVDTGSRRHELAMGRSFAGKMGAELFALAEGSGRVYGVPDGYRALALKSDLAFRDRYPLGPRLHGVASVALAAGRDTLTLRPGAGTAWNVDGEQGTPGAPPPDRASLLTPLFTTPVDSIVPASGPGAIRPAAGPSALGITVVYAAGGTRRLEVAGRPLAPSSPELWPARLTISDPARTGEVFLLDGAVIRPLLALTRDATR